MTAGRSLRTLLRLTLLAAWGCGLPAADLSSVHAGQRVTIAYPELPTPIVGGTAQVVISLPADFNPAKSYGIYLWYNGGGGGAGIDDTFSFPERTICLSIPLFQRVAGDPVPPDLKSADLAPPGDIHLCIGDWYKNWRALQVVIADLKTIAPHLDPEFSYVGGYSNGGHVTGFLAAHSPAFCSMFKGYLFIEGGFDGHHELSTVSLLSGSDKKVYVVGGEKSLAVPLRTGIYEPCIAAKIDAFYLFEPGAGHGYEQQYKPDTRAWIMKKIFYDGLDDRLAELKVLMAKKKWSEAVATYREAARIVDDRSDAKSAVAESFLLLDRQAQEAIGKISIDKASTFQLKRLVETWWPCPSASPARERLNQMGVEEMGKLPAQGASRVAALRRFIKEWSGMPVNDQARSELDILARPDLVKTEAITDDLKRAQALMQVAKTWSETASASEATERAARIGDHLLKSAVTEAKLPVKAKKVEQIAMVFKGTPVGSEADDAFQMLVNSVAAEH
jgi:hypothetical protein